MVDTSGTSALRIATPAYQAFDPSAAEVGLLSRMTPETIGGMYGLLLNAQADRQASSDQYVNEFRGSNALQQSLARAKLEQDERENVRKTGVSLVQYGHAPVSALLPSFGLPGVADGHSPEQRMQLLQGGDQLRQLATRAEALKNSGAGAWDWTQAGVTFDQGQRTNSLDPNVLMGLNTNTQAPLRLREQALQNAGNAAQRTADEGKITVDVNPFSKETTVRMQGRDPQTVFNRASTTAALFREARDAQITAAGGNMTSANTVGAGHAVAPTAATRPGTPGKPAAATGPSAGIPTTTPATRQVVRTGPASEEEKARAKPLEARIGTITGYVRRPDGLYAIGTGGRERVP